MDLAEQHRVGTADGAAPQSLPTGRALQFKRELAGLPYQEQKDRVRPSAPVQMAGAGGTPTLEDRAKDHANWKDGSVTAHVAANGLSCSAWDLWLAVFKGVETGNYADFETLAKTVTAGLTMPPGKPLVLWSGDGTEALANATGTSLNSTELGKLLKGLKAPGAWPQQKRLWEIISKEFVEKHAKGAIHVFCGSSLTGGWATQRGGIRPETVFGGTEKGVVDGLVANGVVMSVTYHCIVPDGAGGFKDDKQVTDPAQVPQPRSLYWTTGKQADIPKDNTAAHVIDPATGQPKPPGP